MDKRNFKTTYLLLLPVAFFIYSSTGVFMKLASMHQMLSTQYLLYFAFVIIAMGIYAVLWQIILKKLALSRAYLFKSLAVLFSLFFAWSIFHEIVTLKNIVGCALIIAGIVLNSYRQAV